MPSANLLNKNGAKHFPIYGTYCVCPFRRNVHICHCHMAINNAIVRVILQLLYRIDWTHEWWTNTKKSGIPPCMAQYSHVKMIRMHVQITYSWQSFTSNPLKLVPRQLDSSTTIITWGFDFQINVYCVLRTKEYYFLREKYFNPLIRSPGKRGIMCDVTAIHGHKWLQPSSRDVKFPQGLSLRRL